MWAVERFYKSRVYEIARRDVQAERYCSIRDLLSRRAWCTPVLHDVLRREEQCSQVRESKEQR